jgi:predicted phage terminase large subunit-like protein
MSTYLSPDQQKELEQLKAEAERRGINVQEEIKKTNVRWPFDVHGFITKRDGTRYEPSESQGGFIDSPALFSAFIGSRGSGKSGAGAQKAMRKIAKGGSGAVLNPDFENFKTSTWPEFREWIPWGMVAPKYRYMGDLTWSPHQPFTLPFVNGAKVICKGVKDPNSARGPNLNWIWIDEAQRDPLGEAWKIAVPSVRVGENPQSFVTATPSGKYHWMYDFFVKEDIPDDVIEVLEEMGFDGKLIEWFHGTVDDNKDHLDKMFYAQLLYLYADDKHLKKQELEGLFVTPEGSLGDRSWFDGKILDEVPEEREDEDGEMQPVKIRKRVRYWDLAATEKKMSPSRRKKKDPDETCGTKKSWDGEVFYIENQTSGRWLFDDILHNMYLVAVSDGPMVEIFVEQEPGAGGKNQIAAIQKFFREGDATHAPLPQFKVTGHKPEGDKVMRANIWFAEARKGLIYLIKGKWNEPFLDQTDNFPDAPYDDNVDSESGARHCVAPIISWSNVPFLKM